MYKINLTKTYPHESIEFFEILQALIDSYGYAEEEDGYIHSFLQ